MCLPTLKLYGRGRASVTFPHRPQKKVLYIVLRSARSSGRAALHTWDVGHPSATSELCVPLVPLLCALMCSQQMLKLQMLSQMPSHMPSQLMPSRLMPSQLMPSQLMPSQLMPSQMLSPPQQPQQPQPPQPPSAYTSASASAYALAQQYAAGHGAHHTAPHEYVWRGFAASWLSGDYSQSQRN